ncbi:Fe2+-dependent dioxygenase [Pseudofulvimonas gallinarii]|uniref:PKHD-type hydroxylase n=1 Tax=Pseudofulvimonas gallinarii TaxID=634155 RepID=A0A4V3UUP4_9GAMM|nr:Fe2+-dependent dioxygenase [Pseudofulvimonas gallinarii]TCS99727.1 PKHD-type hydroxylase [Pseudofulvimonas gallinarii]THD15321.1 Fe2+-dependent dioxygenase [Pseudofulvimonas gallinarii]
MFHAIPDLLSREQLDACRTALEQAEWQAGSLTAGIQAARVKANEQLPADSRTGQRLGEGLLELLGRQPLFLSLALPLKIVPPRFNRYRDGGHYGDHIDAAILSVPGTPHRIRSDLSATVFLSDPDTYDGGELVIGDGACSHEIKLPAGHMVLYPSTSLHRVAPVTRGTRLAAFFWVQSLVREASQRAVLFELDTAIQQLRARVPDDPSLDTLTGVYHNLLRQWSQP